MRRETNDIGAVEEAKKIVKAAEDSGLKLRLIGGLKVRFHCHGQHSTHLRAYQDIDLFGLSKQYEKIASFFRKLGYSPNVRFNALYGATRLQFIGQKGGNNVEIFLDKFVMDHTLDFRKRLELDNSTIPITDLLLTKLQIVRLTAKDLMDIITILEDHAVGYAYAKEMLNVDYIAELCSGNWGLYKTVTENLSKMIEYIGKGSFRVVEKKDLVGKLEFIQTAINRKEKTLRWKLRRVVGERVKWYPDVELGEGEM